MTFKVADRVKESCTSPGTGTVTLSGAVTGFQSFSSAIGANNTTYYVIADQSGANWEVGLGTVGAGGTTLARTSVLASSNGGSLTNFVSGSQYVWVDYPASRAVWLDINGDISEAIRNISGITGAITAPESITFDTTPTTIPTATGSIFWDEGNKTPSVVLDADVVLQLGQENVALVYNGTGSTITNGSVVAVNGAQGQRPSVALADADSEALSAPTLGIATEDIANGAEGFITTFGFVRGINTSAFTAGAPIYLSQTAGQFTQTRPAAPAHTVALGWVIKVNASSGEVFVNINNGWELDELHNVLISSPTGGQLLAYDQTNSYWKNISLGAGTGFTATAGTGGTLSIGASVAAVGTWMATPSSANLAAAVTDETGTGALVFANSPTLVTPALGTPASGNLANCTNLPPAQVSDQANTSTGYFDLPAGTTAQRPGSPNGGMLRQNTTTGLPEWYDANSASWVAFNANPPYAVEYLVIAGGGGGGYGRAATGAGGGGGAGGYRSSIAGETSGGGGARESTLTVTPLTAYTVTVGAGGATQASGSNSVFGSITSVGGGVGVTGPGAGTSGGSGGGGAGGGAGGAGTTNQGYRGGNQAGAAPGTGGGGAAGQGQDINTGNYAAGGNGGSAKSSSANGTSTARAGGGGGGAYGAYAGGTGGGGGAGSGNGGSATANTGSGGAGGRGDNDVTSAGGAGGSGIVIVRYQSTVQKGTGGTVTQSGGYFIHTFTSSGTYTA